MLVFYALPIIFVVQVNCLVIEPRETRPRYRYETPTIKFQRPTVHITAPRAQLNIPARPGLQNEETATPVVTPSHPKFPALTLTATPSQAKLPVSEPPIISLLLPPALSKEENNLSNKEPLFPPGHTEVSPYFADPDGYLDAPSPPDTNASDLTDDVVNLCPVNISECDPSYPWRRVEGHCNNLANPHFGSANQPMPRLLGAKFDFGMVRTFGEDGTLLPNPRSISVALNLPARRSTNHNLLIMQIGQFVDHDHVLSSGIKGPNGTNRKCKSCKSWTDPVCMPIPIPSTDPFFPSHSADGTRNCLPFTRNVVRPGKFNTVDPLNFNTAFLDLSTVYASDHCQCNELRMFRNGLMRMAHLYDVPKGLPPTSFQGFEECRLKSKKCMLTGDVRSNEHMTLLMMHTVFLREHNRIAEKLHYTNKHWDDERLFQESRRINIAQYQHIIYQEYLPALIGFTKAREYGLQALARGYYKDYSEEINPGIVNEFAGAAYRIGHSMVPEAFPKYSDEFQFVGELPLLETFHNPDGFGNPKEFDDCIRGLLATRLPALDLHFEDVIKRHLFEKKDKPFSGEDLLARNIARGREFGFPGYINYVKFCGVKSEIKTWTDLYTLMDPTVVQHLQRIYKHPKDIDLFVGGMSEYQSPGALVGPTFSCIIANQFVGVKRGDRFWYENEANGFTLQQLDSIRKTSRWSRILCTNLNEPSLLPFYSTIIPIKSLNPLVRCDQLEDLDLSSWIEHHDSHPESCIFRSTHYNIGDRVPMSACSSCICSNEGKVNCVAANVNCQHLSQRDLLEEACQLICGPGISRPEEHAEDVDGTYINQ